MSWGSGLGLRRGDPAAVVDVSTGAIGWLAINGDERRSGISFC